MIPTAPRPIALRAALCAATLAGCAPEYEAADLSGRAAPVVDGTISWDRPEVGTIFIGGGMCTATLITPQVIVSAAHCVDYGSTSRTGAYGRFVIQASASSGQLRYAIDMYRSFGRNGALDVSVLHLAEPVPASVATPAAIARTLPPTGDALTLFGYGCTRRNTSIGTGQKRVFQFPQGNATARLCPGDSGGPVMWDRWGAVARVNSAYILDGTGRDVFGDIPTNYDRIIEQIAAWGSAPPRVSGDGTPPPPPPVSPSMPPVTPSTPPVTPSTPPSPPPSGCGEYAGWNIWSCIDARTRVRCIGGALQRETCSNRCVAQPVGVDDFCAADGEPCGPYTGWNIWSCIDARTRVRCIAGSLQRDTCTTRCVVRPPGVDDYCAPTTTGEACGAYEGWTIWSCIDARTRVRCIAGTLQRDTCATSCVGQPVGVDDYCAAASAPPPTTPPMTPSTPGTPRPPGDVSWTNWPSQQTRSNGAWGTALTDIVRHLPASYGDTYADSDLVTYGHETTHGINSHARNYLNTTGRRVNGFYCMSDRVALVREPAIRKSAVAAYVPASLRGSRFSTYVTGQTAWDDTPLYLFDEWVAYTNGSEVGVDLARNGLWRYGWRDAVAGTLEFTVYALAVGMAVEAGDPTYFRDEAQFRAFLAWNARRAMDLYRQGAPLESFRWSTQENFYRTLRESPDAEALREFARRTYGRAWAAEVLGLDP